jgi:hypothetical protein
MALGLLASTPAVASDTNSLFNAKEFSLSLGSGYVLDTSAPFQQEYAFNLAASAGYYLTRNLGLDVTVPFYTTKGVAFQEVQAGAILRLPLSSHVSVLKNVAPYIGVGGVYNWHTDSDWAYIGKAGAEVRLNAKWGVFVEGQYRHTEFGDWANGQKNIFGGVRIVF